MTKLDIRPIAGALGAEIHGVALDRELDPEIVAALRQALLDHLVIFFRDQELPPQRFLAFGRRFGEPIEYPFVRGIEGYPEIIQVAKLEHERVNFGGIWHSDTTYLQTPPMGTMLVAREVPPFGGDTLFANQYLAYEALSDGMKRLLEGLKGVNSSAKANTTRTREDRVKSDPSQRPNDDFVAEHPVVRTHPETGRKALYVNIGHTVRFAGMTEEESTPILTYLFEHQTRPEFTCRFSWKAGSLAFWDNRAAQHNPVNDYRGYRRIMHRITLAGDTPR
ncbi:MAG TPA: TauD/TfdA family dioxygenase [Stellaceae bacterium]|nr:TauD/TfdA family dioxygenase [Stellaceae bacterium]